MAVFYFCKECGNVFTSVNKATVNCCGETWNPLEVAGEPNEKHQLDVKVENGKRIYTSHHPQTDEHYFAFIAFECKCGTTKIRYFKPNEEVRFCLDEDKHGKLYWFCNLHGLYEVEV